MIEGFADEAAVSGGKIKPMSFAARGGLICENEDESEGTGMSKLMIGGGKRPFPEAKQKQPFKMTDSRTFGSGVAVHTYEPA